MRQTSRSLNALHLFLVARWLSTSQVHHRFFDRATLDAARKWLRKHVDSHYLAVHRAHRMAEAFFTLGPEGKRALERAGADEIRLERTPPKQLEHLAGINDIRIAAELEESLAYFFACWELPALGWQHAVIPDAVCAFSNRTYAFEYDRGMEGVQFFARTKIPMYERGFKGLPLAAVVIITDGRRRMENLRRAIGLSHQTILFGLRQEIRTRRLSAPVFYRNGEDDRVCLV